MLPGGKSVRKHSESFELSLVLFVWALVSLFQPIFEHLFAGAQLTWLESYMGISQAEVIARLSEIALPITGCILLILALYRFLEREVRHEFEDEDARLKKRLADLLITMRLADLRTEGVVLRNRGETIRVGISEWITECMDWTRRVVETIAIISPADAAWFNILDAVPAPRVPIKDSYNPVQLKAYREHDFYLAKLERLLEKYR